MTTKRINLDAASKVSVFSKTKEIVAPGEGGRWYVIMEGTPPKWYCSFPTEGAALQWLMSPVISTDDMDADMAASEAKLKSFGGERPIRRGGSL